MSAQRLWRLPMLTRVLGVMLAAVIAVQAVTFVLLQFGGLPSPPVFTVARVAAVLRSGRPQPGALAVSQTSTMPPRQGGRAIVLTAALARELEMSPAMLSLGFIDPPHIGLAFRKGPPPRLDQGDARQSLLIGDFTAALKRPDGHWLVVRPVRSGLEAWRISQLLALLAAVASILPFAWLLARWVTRPVATFAHAAERIGRNPQTPPLPISGPAEIADAARAMNEMQDRLNRYIDSRTVMIGAIAHDLRTPLMRMSLRLEGAPAELRHGVERDMADMRAMIEVATDYVEGAVRTGPRRRLDLRSLVETAVDDHVELGEEATIESGERVVIEGDPVGLRAAVDNLLNNALRYAGDAEVRVATEDRHAVIEVRDHGPGILPEDLERMFEPFVRGEASRNRKTGGTGLGLASVRGVVGLHGGEASLRNHPDGGLVARIALPL